MDADSPVTPARIALPPPDLDYSIRSAKSAISSAYELEFEDLKLEEANRFDDHSEITLSHTSSNRSFTARIDRSGYAASIYPTSK